MANTPPLFEETVQTKAPISAPSFEETEESEAPELAPEYDSTEPVREFFRYPEMTLDVPNSAPLAEPRQAPSSNKTLDLLKRIPAGIAEAATVAFQGLQEAGEAIQPFTPMGQAIGLIPGAQEAQQAAGGATRAFARDIQERAATDYGVDPARDQELGSKIVGAATSVVPIIASGGTLAPAVGGALAGESARQDAEAAGADEDQQAIAFWGNAVVGAVTEKILGIPAIFKMAQAKGVPAKTFGQIVQRGIVNAAKAAPMEAGQEGLQRLAENFIASDLSGYDPERGLTEGVAESAGIGALVGGGIGGVTGMAGARDQQVEAERQIPEPESVQGKAIRSLVGDDALTEARQATGETVAPTTPGQPTAESPVPQESATVESSSPAPATQDDGLVEVRTFDARGNPKPTRVDPIEAGRTLRINRSLLQSLRDCLGGT